MSLLPNLRRVLIAGFLAVAAAGAAVRRRATRAAVLRATLANGLRVVIVRNTLAPVVATSVNYLVGSDETPAGFPGTAHAQEHMMFRGSPGLTADQLANIGSVMGGNFNANTRESLTQYLYTVPAEDLDVALHIEALRMQGVTRYAEGVGSRARRHRAGSGAGSVRSLLCPVFESSRGMFAGTPYAHDALGTRPSFEKTTAADAQAASTTPGTRRTTRSWSSPATSIRRRR